MYQRGPVERTLVLALLLAAALASPTPAASPPFCAQYFHAACSEATGKWLPSFGYPSDFWDGATRITQRDTFSRAHAGTLAVFSNSLQKAYVTYDRAHHLAFYRTGCCSWGETVLAYASPPPKTVVDGDLSGLKTARGIRLGMSPADVMGVYGNAKAQIVPQHAGVSVLAYTTWPPRNQLSKTHSECGQFQNFYFQDNRLVLIQLGNGC